MYLIQKSLYALVVLATLSGINSTPTDAQRNSGVFTASDNTLASLDQRDKAALVAADSALKALTSADANTFALAPRAGPPTHQDFVNFFKGKKRNGDSGKLVFWSTVGIAESQKFAAVTGRKTLEMILGDNWSYYQRIQANDGYWPDWPSAITGFWDPVSEACAQWATGVVYFYGDRNILEDQTRPTCPKCWYRKEKPTLLASMDSQHEPRVTEIQRWTYPWREGKGPAGLITGLNNKRDLLGVIDDSAVVDQVKRDSTT